MDITCNVFLPEHVAVRFKAQTQHRARMSENDGEILRERQMDPVTGRAFYTGYRIALAMYSVKDLATEFTNGCMTLEDTLMEISEKLNEIRKIQLERRDVQNSGGVQTGDALQDLRRLDR